jgi:hypothetical protein
MIVEQNPLLIFPSNVFTTGHGYCIMKFAVLACLVLVQLGFEFSRVALKVEQKLITDSPSREIALRTCN